MTAKSPMPRAFHNDNGWDYTLIKGGKPYELAILAKHSHPDGLDFIVAVLDGPEERSWCSGSYHATIEEALEHYELRGGL